MLDEVGGLCRVERGVGAGFLEEEVNRVVKRNEGFYLGTNKANAEMLLVLIGGRLVWEGAYNGIGYRGPIGVCFILFYFVLVWFGFLTYFECLYDWPHG